jgi:hypothetical protein
MSQDQFSAQDTTSQHVQPDALPDEQIEHPGLESDMALEPDYGESTGLRGVDLPGQRPAGGQASSHHRW